MKKIVIGMLAVASFIFSANAQETRKMKSYKPGYEKGMMMKDLNLTAAQQEQMKANRESFKSQMMELNKNENLTVKEYKARKADLLKSQKAKMDQVLTVEQRNQLAKKNAGRKGKHDMQAAKGLDNMKENLNLTDAQVSKLQANREVSQAKAKAIKENSKLSETERKEQMMALRQEQKNSMKQVLTAEQISKMEEQKKDRKEKSPRK